MMLQADYRPPLADLRPLVSPGSSRASASGGTALRSPASEFAGRSGYDAAFLGEYHVELPSARDGQAADVLAVRGDAAGRLDYLHFTVVMSRSRRPAMFTAVNIDGSAAVPAPRDGDPWALDGRIDPSEQIGPDLYEGNDLDRGHLVRRQDPVWGVDAKTANRDTFHYTNCAPQLAAFNQKTWLSLEDYILLNTQRWKERASVFTGPLFKKDDPLYRGVRIPLAYWKVVAFLGDDGRPSATAYMIEQDVDPDKLSLIFGPFKTYQRSIASVEEMTGLSFGPLSRFDGFSNEERQTGQQAKRLIRNASDILVSDRAATLPHPLVQEPSDFI